MTDRLIVGFERYHADGYGVGFHSQLVYSLLMAPYWPLYQANMGARVKCLLEEALGNAPTPAQLDEVMRTSGALIEFEMQWCAIVPELLFEHCEDNIHKSIALLAKYVPDVTEDAVEIEEECPDTEPYTLRSAR